MSSPADYFRALADSIRSIPADFGLREHSATLTWHDFSGQSLGSGAECAVGYPILVNGANPKVRFPSQKEVALGLMSKGSCTVGPFTPQFLDGGINRALLNGSRMANGGALPNGTELFVKVVGPQCPDGILYRIENNNVDHAIRVTLSLLPVGPDGASGY